MTDHDDLVEPGFDHVLKAAFDPKVVRPLDPYGSALAELDSRIDLRTVPDGEAPLLAADPASLAAAGRYQILGEIARGGMGVVLKARDPDLRRDVALKVLAGSALQRPDLARRFVEEAQICGQLQHPGIVPVYEVGLQSAEQPYFTMKLLRGRTLADLLARRRDPGEDQHRFLSAFAQVCETIAYAHACGVVHRDLKPANVMIGRFGEVQVIDWGLAKVLGAEIEPAAVVGTPAYMPPEQARGEAVDARADVFALGAMLCEILAGRPPWLAASAEGSIELARKGDAGEALRAIGERCREQGLLAIARECLAARDDRPRDGEVVAQRLRGHLDSVAERARAAELAAARAEQRAREERRVRRLSVTLVCSIAITFAAAGGGWWWWHSTERERLAELETRVQGSMDEALRLQGQAVATALADAASLLAQAVAAAATACEVAAAGRGSEIERRALALRSRLELDLRGREQQAEGARRQDALLAALRAAAVVEDEGWTEYAPLTWRVRWLQWLADRYPGAFAAHGMDVDALPAPSVVELLSGEHAIEFAGALDQWASARRALAKARGEDGTWLQPVGHLVAIAGQLDPDPWRNQLRALMAQEPFDLARFEQLAAPPADTEKVVTNALLLGAMFLAQNRLDDARRLWERCRLEHPEDFSLNFLLGVGALYDSPPRFGDALIYSGAAVAVAPRSAGATMHVANACMRSGDFAGARDWYLRATVLQPSSTLAECGLCVALTRLGKVTAAIERLEAATRRQPRCADFWVRLGECRLRNGQNGQAILDLLRAVHIDPRHGRPRCQLGLALLWSGHRDLAVAWLETAVAIDPRADNALFHLADFWLKSGECGNAAHLRRAEAGFRRCIGKGMTSHGHFGLGLVAAARGQEDAAVAALRRSIAADPGHAAPLVELGRLYAESFKWPQAIEALRAATLLAPLDMYAHYLLANAFLGADEREAASTTLQRARQLPPPVDLTDAARTLGHLCRLDRDLAGAAAHYRRWARLDPMDGKARILLGIMLRNVGRIDESIAELRAAIRCNELVPHPWCQLGGTLAEDGRHAESLAAHERGHELGSKRADWRFPSSTWVAEARKSCDRQQALLAIADGERWAANPEESARAGAAALQVGRPEDALRLFQAAVAADAALLDDVDARHHFIGARAAIRVAATLGAHTDEAAALRALALAWLHRGLAAARRAVANDKGKAQTVANGCTRWLDTADLAPVRDAGGLARLPEAERLAWQRLWAEVTPLAAWPVVSESR